MKKIERMIRGLAGVAGVGAGSVALIASKNSKAMNACVRDTLSLFSKGHTVTPVNNNYAVMTAHRVMKFHVQQYRVEKIGNLSVMTMNVGLMQMATIVLTPTEKDLPLLSCDYMYILSSRKAYIELYDLVEQRDEAYKKRLSAFAEVRKAFNSMKDISASPAWYEDLLTETVYKAGTVKEDEMLKSLLLESVKEYIRLADETEELTDEGKEAKLDRIKTYSDRLIDEGGISTDFFKSSFGSEVTRDFFDNVFFGTATYRKQAKKH